jgi:hypothetical protein
VDSGSTFQEAGVLIWHDPTGIHFIRAALGQRGSNRTNIRLKRFQRESSETF